MKVSHKIVASVLGVTLLLSGCGKDEGSSTEDLAKDITPKPSASSGPSIEKKESGDVEISVLERVYESKSGLQLISKYQFACMLNNSTTFQLEYAEPDDSVVVRVDKTDFYPVDYDRLAKDEKLFTDMIAPKNAERNGAQFSVDGQIAMLRYKTGSPPNSKYCVSAVVYTGDEVLKVYTESMVDYYTDVLYTLDRVEPKSNESYTLVIKEIDKLCFKDIAVNVPFNAHDKWDVHSEGKKIKVTDDNGDYIELFYDAGKTAADFPKPEAIIENLGWENTKYEEDTDEESGVYLSIFNADGDRWFGVVGIPVEGGIYLGTAQGPELVQYLWTIRGKTAPDIYSSRANQYHSNDTGSTGAIQDTVRLQDLQFSISTGAIVNQKHHTYKVEYASDDYFQMWPAMREMTASTIKKDSLDIKTSKVEGDHFVAVATDGSTYYYRQFNVDGKLWNIKALGDTGFAIAKSAKVAEDYKYFKDRGWTRIQKDKMTFTAPPATEEFPTETGFRYVFPGGGQLVFEEVKKLPNTKDLPDVYCADESIFYTPNGAYIGVKLAKQYRVTCTDEESFEALYSLRVGK